MLTRFSQLQSFHTLQAKNSQKIFIHFAPTFLEKCKSFFEIPLIDQTFNFFCLKRMLFKNAQFSSQIAQVLKSPSLLYTTTKFLFVHKKYTCNPWVLFMPKCGLQNYEIENVESFLFSCYSVEKKIHFPKFDSKLQKNQNLLGNLVSKLVIFKYF